MNMRGLSWKRKIIFKVKHLFFANGRKDNYSNSRFPVPIVLFSYDTNFNIWFGDCLIERSSFKYLVVSNRRYNLSRHCYFLSEIKLHFVFKKYV